MTRTVLITGSSRGIGFQLVKVFILHEFRVIATCRNPAKARELQQVLEESNQLPPIQCDVSSDDSVRNCLEKVSKITEVIDVLVNNAGISNPDHPDDPPSAVKRNHLMDIMNTNVGGVFAMIQACLPMLQKSKDPKVINISSDYGSISLAWGTSATSYKCSKAALNMLNKCFSLEFPTILFVAIHPGWVQTDLGSVKDRTPPVTMEQSASKVYDTCMNKVTLDDNGTFWSFEGQQFENY